MDNVLALDYGQIYVHDVCQRDCHKFQRQHLKSHTLSGTHKTFLSLDLPELLNVNK